MRPPFGANWRRSRRFWSRARRIRSLTSGSHELQRKLGLVDATSIVVGIIIGAGIFLVPNLVARSLPTAGSILGVWVFAGVLSFFGALAFAELGAMIPATGGPYVYLREAYGPMIAFLCGWTFFLAIQTAATSWLAVGFSIYVGQWVHLTPLMAQAVSLAFLAVLTWVNYRGVEAGARVQNFFTAMKVVGLAILIGSSFLSRQTVPLDWSVAPSGIHASQFGAALVACLVACDGWVNVSFVAGEVRNPQRNLLWSLALGVAICTLVYALANLAYLRVLSVPEIAASERVGAAAAERIMGPLGATIVSITILLSIVGSANGHIMTAPRVYFAQARDGLFFRRFGEVHPRYLTPGFAILIQGVWSGFLAVTGSYETLANYVMFATWIFYALAAAGVIILRRKQPDRPRPYRMWGYPVTPLLFVAISAAFVLNTLITTPRPALLGLLIIASGVPAYYYWRRRS